MALPDPRTFPRFDRFTGGYLKISRNSVRNPLRSGAITVGEFVDPIWVGKFEAVAQNQTEIGLWGAFVNSLRGGLKRFVGYHPLRQVPIAYGIAALNLPRAGGGAFDGTATLTAASANSISLSGLPANYQFTAGDQISLPMASSQRNVHEVTEAIAANGSGIVTLSSFEPFVRSGAVIGSAAVQLIRASCFMVVKEESVSIPERPGGIVSFEAMQAAA